MKIMVKLTLKSIKSQKIQIMNKHTPKHEYKLLNKSLTWSSSDSSLVWVHSGLCGTYAGANGTATITATSHSGVSKSIILTVTNGTIR